MDYTDTINNGLRHLLSPWVHCLNYAYKADAPNIFEDESLHLWDSFEAWVEVFYRRQSLMGYFRAGFKVAK
jgi:hypothetical protein